MQLNKIKMCERADNHLRQLKAKTGLTPNLLCRIGFCLSLRDPIIPDPQDYPEDSTREFNRYTLTGQWDSFFLALLKQWCHKNHIDPSQLEEQFRAHMNRGAIILFQRVKDLVDLVRLVETINEEAKVQQ